METVKNNYSNLNFDKNSRFLITGAAGFIGSNIVEALLKMGYSVRALDNFATGKRENIDLFINNPNFEFIEGDICNFETCEKACQDIDYVIHQAALGSVPRSMKFPNIYQENNIGGTANMMEAAKLANVKRFVYASSSSVYGDSTILPKVEGNEGNILSPYALTKKTNEEYGKLYTQVYGLETIGLRYFNVFGRRQDPHSSYAAVIPIFVKKILNNESPTINGDGLQSRDFTYIENVIEANLKACLAPSEACGKAYNIAYGENITLNELYEELNELLNTNVPAIYGPDREGDIKHSLANIDNTKNKLGYNPIYNINEGLENAIEWYKEYLK
ncbi:MAG: SDR family oxidoreductase [Clostridia bacterium]|nr:SDR family oxidoreductase [Clostridia bacterium]MDD4386501.1 SDR family oxidoreductase [Clostridia bacterium]